MRQAAPDQYAGSAVSVNQELAHPDNIEPCRKELPESETELAPPHWHNALLGQFFVQMLTSSPIVREIVITSSLWKTSSQEQTLPGWNSPCVEISPPIPWIGSLEEALITGSRQMERQSE